jgi:hypothetical protein
VFLLFAAGVPLRRRFAELRGLVVELNDRT